jgi:hypothetical protein
MRSLAPIVAVCVVIASFVPSVRAGTVVVAESWGYDQYSESGTLTMYLEKDRMRVDFTGKDSDVTMIYDMKTPDDPHCWVIDRKEYSYIELDRKGMDKLKSVQEDAMARMNEHLMKLDKEEREAIKSRFKDKIRGLPAARRSKTGTATTTRRRLTAICSRNCGSWVGKSWVWSKKTFRFSSPSARSRAASSVDSFPSPICGASVSRVASKAFRCRSCAMRTRRKRINWK